jgi:hypothetical protein
MLFDSEPFLRSASKSSNPTACGSGFSPPATGMSDSDGSLASPFYGAGLAPSSKAGFRRAMTEVAFLYDVSVEIVESECQRLSKEEIHNSIAALAAQAHPAPELAADIGLVDVGFQRFCSVESCNEIAREPDQGSGEA